MRVVILCLICTDASAALAPLNMVVPRQLAVRPAIGHPWHPCKLHRSSTLASPSRVQMQLDAGAGASLPGKCTTHCARMQSLLSDLASAAILRAQRHRQRVKSFLSRDRGLLRLALLTTFTSISLACVIATSPSAYALTAPPSETAVARAMYQQAKLSCLVDVVLKSIKEVNLVASS